MRLKTAVLSAAIMTTVVANSTLTSSPAQAIAGKFTVDLTNRINSVSSTEVDIDNSALSLTTKSGIFADFTTATFKDLTFSPALTSGTTSTLSYDLPSFITLAGGSSGSITFNLTQLLDVSFTDITGDANGIFSAKLKGVFQPGSLPNDSGRDFFLTFKSSANSGVTAEFTAVPTPALLPGLLAVGAAALRKRKKEATEVTKLEV